MKRLITLIAIIGLAALSLQAQRRYVQPIDKSITAIVMEENASASIIFDTATWVESTVLMDAESGVVFYGNGTLNISDYGLQGLTIHIDPRHLRSIQLYDLSNATLWVKNYPLNNFTIEASGESELNVLGDTLQCTSLVMVASENANLSFPSACLSARQISCSAIDLSSITIKSIMASKATINAMDEAVINFTSNSQISELTAICDGNTVVNLGNISGNKYLLTAYDESHIKLNGNWASGSSHTYNQGQITFKGNAAKSSKTKHDFVNNTDSQQRSRLMRNYTFRDRMRINYSYGFNGWGDRFNYGIIVPFSLEESLMRFTLNGGRSHMLDIDYALFMNPHWRIGVGVGIMADRYDCSFYGLSVADSTISFALNTNYLEAKMRVKTFYTTYFAEYRTRSGWAMDLTAMIGLNYTTNRTGLFNSYQLWGNESGVYNHSIESYLKPLRIGLRVSLGGDRFRIFYQVSTLPLFNEEVSRKIYPFVGGVMFKF